ncbi:MAG: alkane 1-monooxygenase [Saprospiraceae bacterium]|nr:alkane 1-monooxygenase [Saprospiraceae bacterium]
MTDIKYLLAYIFPLTTFIAVYSGGWVSYLTVIVTFGIVPILEQSFRQDTENLTVELKNEKSKSKYFDFLLYVNLFWVYGILTYIIYTLKTFDLALYEIIGIILSAGIMLGSNGINVAHELGHKQGWLQKTAAKILLLPSLYMHFYIEHNRGHHLRVGTLEDPATSRYNENIFIFWIRSIRDSWLSAWKICAGDMIKKTKSKWSLSNPIIRYSILQVLYLTAIILFFGLKVFLTLLSIAVISILLLESINYIEHYGLLRNKNRDGKYERVENFHSWNSDHIFGRIMLFELTRHSDHHFKSSKKYQILDHYDESPQLPYGYPTSIIIALIPPLWFGIMNPKVDKWLQKYYLSTES